MIRGTARDLRRRLAAGATTVCAVATAGAMIAGPLSGTAEARGLQADRAAVAAVAALPTPPPGGHCSKVTIIGARGSGQPYDTGGPFKGFGPEVLKAITVIEGHLRAKKVSYAAESVKYPAASVNVLKPATIDFIDWTDYLNNHVGKFVQSINTGVNEAVNYARWAQQTCHNSKIVMVGYSQGAMVMHDAEVQLRTKDRAAFNLIIGTVLQAGRRARRGGHPGPPAPSRA